MISIKVVAVLVNMIFSCQLLEFTKGNELQHVELFAGDCAVTRGEMADRVSAQKQRLKHVVYIMQIYIYIPRTQITTMFEGQPPQNKAFSNQNRVIWVPGIDMFKYVYPKPFYKRF